jgi:hypothetical protein
VLADAGERVRIASVHPDDLRRGRPVFWTSSLSGAVGVTAVDATPLAVATDLLRMLNERLAGGHR